MLENLLDELKFVFDDEDKKWIEASRTVTDITTLAVKIKKQGFDKLLSEALTKHCMPGGWHFVIHNALYSDGGKTAGRILKKKSRFNKYMITI